MILRFKGSVACHQLEDGDAQGPEIDPFIISSTQVHLWGLIKVSPDDGQHISPCSPLEGLLADAKVNYLEDLGLWAVEHILRLDIPMTDISIMQILNGLHKLPNNPLQLSLILDIALT